MYNQTTLDWLRDAATEGFNQCLSNYEIILTTVLALVALMRGRQFWMNVIHFWMLIEGVAGTLFPEKMLRLLVEGTPDDAHVHIMRFVGLLILFACAGYFLLSRSTDSTVQTSLLWATTVFCSLTLLALAYLITHPIKKSPVKLNEAMASPFYSMLVFVVVTAYFALQSTDWGGYSETPSHANLHLKVEFVFLMMFGVFLYALPQWVLRVTLDVEKLDALHTFLARCAGSYMILMAIMSGRSANFLRPTDKDIHMFLHWKFFVICAVFGVVDLYQKRADVTWQRIGLQTGSDVLLIMNATGALNIDPSVVQRAVLPRVKACYRDAISIFKRKQY